MINKTIKFSMLAFTAVLATGCATSSDVSKLQNQINDMKAQVQTASTKADRAESAANSVQATAESANRKAASAESLALEANAAAQEANGKLDRMFKRSMMK